MKQYLIGNENGSVLGENLEITDNIEYAKHYDNIGDAYRSCIEVNKQVGNYTFKVIPI